MKKILIIVGIVVMMFGFVACANNDEGNNDVEDTINKQGNVIKEENRLDTSSQGLEEQMDKLDYKEFELEVSYGNNKEYEAEIEYDNGRVTAEIEDELKGIKLKGREAFDEIHPRLKMIVVDKSTSKEDVIRQVLDAFELPDNYEEFKVEITFKDNTEIEIEDEGNNSQYNHNQHNVCK